MNPSVRKRSRCGGFTFIELIVAVALSVVLMRGMYTVFYSASRLSRLSEQRIAQLLEISAFFDHVASDVTRVPSGVTRYFNAPDATELRFMVTSDGSSTAYVYVKYKYESGKIVRSVWKDVECLNRAEESDEDVVVASKVAGFEANCHTGSGWDTGDQHATKAVRFIVEQGSPSPGADVPNETYTIILPVMAD